MVGPPASTMLRTRTQRAHAPYLTPAHAADTARLSHGTHMGLTSPPGPQPKMHAKASATQAAPAQNATKSASTTMKNPPLTFVQADPMDP